MERLVIPWEWDRAMHRSQSSLTVTGTAEESDRHMPRTITPYRGAINESRWEGGPQLLTLTRCLRAFSNLFDTLFDKKSILK